MSTMEQQDAANPAPSIYLTYLDGKAIACYTSEKHAQSAMLYDRLSMTRLNSDDYRIHSTRKYLDRNIPAVEVLSSQWIHQIVPLSTGQVIPLSFSFDE